MDGLARGEQRCGTLAARSFFLLPLFLLTQVTGLAYSWEKKKTTKTTQDHIELLLYLFSFEQTCQTVASWLSQCYLPRENRCCSIFETQQRPLSAMLSLNGYVRNRNSSMVFWHFEAEPKLLLEKNRCMVSKKLSYLKTRKKNTNAAIAHRAEYTKGAGTAIIWIIIIIINFCCEYSWPVSEHQFLITFLKSHPNS